jgi:hypothetical protein
VQVLVQHLKWSSWHPLVEPLVTLLNKVDNLGKQHASAALARLTAGSK